MRISTHVSICNNLTAALYFDAPLHDGAETLDRFLHILLCAPNARLSTFDLHNLRIPMNQTPSRHLYCLVAAAFCLSTGALGCASSNESMEADSDEQVSSAPDYESTDDGDETSSPSETDSMKKSNSMEKPSSGEQTSISDAELQEFGAINRDMKKIQQEARRKMQAAESRDKARTVKKNMQKKVKAVFQDHSMSRERYGEIGRTLRSKPKLQKRYRNIMQSKSSK